MAEAAAENWIFVSYDSANNETNMKREYVRYCEASENISFVETLRNFSITKLLCKMHFFYEYSLLRNNPK